MTESDLEKLERLCQKKGDTVADLVGRDAVFQGVVPKLISEIRSLQGRLEVVEKALDAIANEQEPCRKCGKPHPFQKDPSGEFIGTWVNAKDGHVYYRKEAVVIARETFEALAKIREEKE